MRRDEVGAGACRSKSKETFVASPSRAERSASLALGYGGTVEWKLVHFNDRRVRWMLFLQDQRILVEEWIIRGERDGIMQAVVKKSI